MIIKFLKRSVIEVLEAVSALASVFAYMLAANFISELLKLSDGGFMFLATALTGPAINTFMRVTDRFDRWKGHRVKVTFQTMYSLTVTASRFLS